MSWPSSSSPPVPCDGVNSRPSSELATETISSACSAEMNSSNTTAHGCGGRETTRGLYRESAPASMARKSSPIAPAGTASVAFGSARHLREKSAQSHEPHDFAHESFM